MKIEDIRYFNVFQLGVNETTGDVSFVQRFLPPGMDVDTSDDGKLRVPVVAHTVTNIEHLRAIHRLIGDKLAEMDGDDPKADVRLTTWVHKGAAN